MTLWHEERLLIDGDLVAAEGGATFETLNPTHGRGAGHRRRRLGRPTPTGAIAAARRAFDTTSWSTDTAFRVRCLRQLHQALVDHRSELRALLVAEVGAPLMLTEGPQLDTPIGMVGLVRRPAGEVRVPRGPRRVRVPGPACTDRWVEKEAVGRRRRHRPVQLPGPDHAGEAGAGAGRRLHGRPQGPAADAVGQRRARAGSSPRTPTSRPAWSTSSPRPSAGGGRGAGHRPPGRHGQLHRLDRRPAGASWPAASDTVKKVFLELGGKSAFIVLDDADARAGGHVRRLHHLLPRRPGLRHHHPAARAPSRSCRRGRRAGGRDAWPGVPFGDPSDPAMMMGPLISEQQRDKVDGYVRRAVADGAKVVDRRRAARAPAQRATSTSRPSSSTSTPGARSPRRRSSARCWWCCPTATTTTPSPSPTTRSSGCRAPCYGADHERATASPGASAPARSASTAACTTAPDAPFGGYKQSGIGREMGVAGLEEYLEAQDARPPRVADGGGPHAATLAGVRVARGGDVRLRHLGRRRARRLGRRGAQGRARGHRRPPAGPAADGSFVVEGDLNPNVEHPNRGKRSIGLDISVEGGPGRARRPGQAGRRVPHQPAAGQPAARSGIDVDDIRAVNPDVVYARGSAARAPGRGGRPGRLRHDRVLVPGGDGGQHHPARRRRA